MKIRYPTVPPDAMVYTLFGSFSHEFPKKDLPTCRWGCIFPFLKESPMALRYFFSSFCLGPLDYKTTNLFFSNHVEKVTKNLRHFAANVSNLWLVVTGTCDIFSQKQLGTSFLNHHPSRLIFFRGGSTTKQLTYTVSQQLSIILYS